MYDSSYNPVLKIRLFWVIVVVSALLNSRGPFFLEVVNYIFYSEMMSRHFTIRTEAIIFVGSPYTVHTSIQEVYVSTHFSSKWRKSRFCSWRYPCWQRGR